jgi:IclR family transcriptional regulator, KDG regulon repressor
VTRGAQTVHRALDILAAFDVDSPTRTLAEITELVGLTLPTTHRLLKALQIKNMVAWDLSSRKYSLGPAIMRLASVIMSRENLTVIAEPKMQKLRQQSGETVSLHWRMGSERVCVLELVSREPIRMVSGIGRTYPLHQGAAGKAIVASLSPGEVKQLLDSQGISGRPRAAVIAELFEVRLRGYATSLGETVPGAQAIAGSIMSPERDISAAINVTGPSGRFTRNKALALAGPLREACQAIMRQVGASPSDATSKHGSLA